MGTLAIVLQSINALPYIIAGIQAIHGDSKAGADKKTLAIEALGLATAVAGAVLPGEQGQEAQAVGALVSTTIDNFVATFKTLGLFGFKKSLPTPVPTAPVSVAH
jgi:hypothetical protein